jgi:hypothetical protein
MRCIVCTERLHFSLGQVKSGLALIGRFGAKPEAVDLEQSFR